MRRQERAVAVVAAQPHHPRPRLRKEIPDRSEWAATAYRDHGYTLAEIAAAIDLHYSSISKIIKSWEDQQAAG